MGQNIFQFPQQNTERFDRIAQGPEDCDRNQCPGEVICKNSSCSLQVQKLKTEENTDHDEGRTQRIRNRLEQVVIECGFRARNPAANKCEDKSCQHAAQKIEGEKNTQRGKEVADIVSQCARLPDVLCHLPEFPPLFDQAFHTLTTFLLDSTGAVWRLRGVRARSSRDR